MNKCDLSDIEVKILYYIQHSGPVFTKKLSARLDEDIQTVQKNVETLQHKGYLVRVTRTLVDYRINKRNKVTKHRNHTYYDLTRKGRLLMRQFRCRVEVNLKPP
jgi:DNA-binding MarR family transcriptional regulator